jgi:hypothetical protein
MRDRAHCVEPIHMVRVPPQYRERSLEPAPLQRQREDTQCLSVSQNKDHNLKRKRELSNPRHVGLRCHM